MNSNMMCNKRKITVLFFFFCLFLLLAPARARAEEAGLPQGDILIVYSDGAEEEELADIRTIVEILTYQSFQVTFAPASECAGHLWEYRSIIFAQVERYPSDIFQEIYEMEWEARQVLDAGTEENVSAEGDRRLLFLGNAFLHDYLDATGRSYFYLSTEEEVGRFHYSFHDFSEKEGLVRTDGFLFMKGEYDYTSGTVSTGEAEGYFCARKGVLTHISVCEFGSSLFEAAFTREVAQWKWPYKGEPHAYAQYMVLDQVYPFQDPDKLLEIIDLMAAKKEPFVISVMPVYANGDYPAMQHFCEVLRYAQDNGGAVILHSPINQTVEFDVDLINEYITMAVSIYMEHGVYPMGLQVPHNWLFNEDAIEVMSRFGTVLVSGETDANITVSEEMRTNLVYRDGHQWIAPAMILDSDGTSYVKSHSTAVSFDITEDISRIEEKMESCRSSFVPLKSLWDIEHSLWTDEDVLSYRNHIILVNGKRVDKTFTPTEYEEEYSYNRNMLQRFSKDLTNENQKLIAAVVIVSFLFLLFIFLARQNNRRRYFYDKEEEDMDEYWENKK